MVGGAKIWDVAVIGKANMDYLVRGQELPRPGQSLAGLDFQEAPGGKGANQAVGAARLGARVALVARLGTDARGDQVLAALAAENIDLEFVSRDGSRPTGVALCQVGAGGQKQILSAPGANACLDAEAVRSAARVLREARVILVQLGIPLVAIEEALRIGKEAGALVVLDPGPPRPVSDALLAQVDVIRPNASEAEALTGLPVRDRASARDAAARLRARGAGAAVVQAGALGDLVLGPDEELWLPRFAVASIDATGAGDAFASALAVGLAEGRPLREAGPFASAAAALATTVLGAQASLPRRPDVLELLARARRG